jgi:hypothetical protein
MHAPDQMVVWRDGKKGSHETRGHAFESNRRHMLENHLNFDLTSGY